MRAVAVAVRFPATRQPSSRRSSRPPTSSTRRYRRAGGRHHLRNCSLRIRPTEDVNGVTTVLARHADSRTQWDVDLPKFTMGHESSFARRLPAGYRAHAALFLELMQASMYPVA
jgi:hypothetical protein